MSTSALDQRVAAVRRFNRFFTQKIGVLHQGLLDSPFSLAEVRVLYELAHRDEATASELCRSLGLDAGYLSRMIRRFGRENLIRKRPSRSDGRRTHLSLSGKGREVFAALDQRSSAEVAALIGDLADDEQLALVESMARIESLLVRAPDPVVPYVLRPHRPGDMGWVLWRHSVLYQGEYGWNDSFVALVARVVADFVENFDPEWERCWIAERDHRRVGSVFLVRESDELARLRLLLVEPEARGQGIGYRLVRECVDTARQLGYRRMSLWTNDVLHAARRIYEAAGFRLTREERHRTYGPEMVGQDWELEL
jgi:DNA-binding MarR family transcriptional regulator/GNAT superfamily N-acetyltransferase